MRHIIRQKRDIKIEKKMQHVYYNNLMTLCAYLIGLDKNLKTTRDLSSFHTCNSPI